MVLQSLTPIKRVMERVNKNFVRPGLHVKQIVLKSVIYL